MADETRLYSAFYNLTHNAIPEVPPQGSITIHGELDASHRVGGDQVPGYGARHAAGNP